MNNNAEKIFDQSKNEKSQYDNENELQILQNSENRNILEQLDINDTIKEGSPIIKFTHRKMSADIRSKLSFIQPHEDNSKPVKLKNLLTQFEVYDVLHKKSFEVTNTALCDEKTCLGSVLHGTTFQIDSNEFRKPETVMEYARDFLLEYFSSIRRNKTEMHEQRLKTINAEILKTGTYNLSETELIFGAKLAWRNSARCIGRIQWSKLQVFDCRFVTTTSGMFEAICNHIKYATNKGNLRSAITVFPQRTDGKHDYRIWNHQLISYAGYRTLEGEIIGDPATIEFTELCLKMGWKGKKTHWDILPLVLSANGHDPDYFDLPSELILEVNLEHPQYSWFAELGLKWYALPAVSNMLFDCGGLQFTATAFSGWYMSTEIGCRNLCDTNRRNLIEKIARKLNLDVQTPTSLWKDKTLVEVNVAVLYSFHSQNITIVDHHTASESFMKHFENEMKLRNGCPADWIWIVPPMSSSITPVFHQEMVMYKLKPSFEYQEPAYKVHLWKKDKNSSKTRNTGRKFHFKQIARAVKFTSKLFGRALSRRIKATILYATETGKSEQYAKQLIELLAHAFNAQIYCTSTYDITSIEHEALLIIVASTFGNGDPPENGEDFAQSLYSMRNQQEGGDSSKRLPSKSFKANFRIDSSANNLRLCKMETESDGVEDVFGPLSNVRFAVFALGSSAYPNFCAYGNYLDKILGELGGERIMEISYGDEICGQEHAFNKWASKVYKRSCETFCLDIDETVSASLQAEIVAINNTRLIKGQGSDPVYMQLSKYHNKTVSQCFMKTQPTNLHSQSDVFKRSTILVEIKNSFQQVKFQPGDHVGIFAENRLEIVNGILERLTGVQDNDDVLQLQILKEKHTSTGILKNWEAHEKIPVCSLRQLLTRFLDITTPPSRQLMKLLSNYCLDNTDETNIAVLANNPTLYEDWRCSRFPNLLELLREFPSCRPPASLLVAHLMPLQPRFYSISSSQQKFKDEIHLTVAVVKYIVNNDREDVRYGVCSNYLEGLQENANVYLFVRNASNFHLPLELKKPVILFGPGTGIAPYRSFWQHCEYLKETCPDFKLPKIWLFFGCRTKALDLYFKEKQEMVKKGVLDRVYLALSREQHTAKTYVQDIAKQEAKYIYDLLVTQKGHIYVCGDITMAEHVYMTIRDIIAMMESKTVAESEKFMLNLKDENRYHEDIFGITLRTAEIQNKSRATARIRMESQP